MNEQQLADLFSEQLDLLLTGQPSVIPPEAGDLQGLVDLGQQFTHVDFQMRPAGQLAFQHQLSTWFGLTSPATSTFLGLSKVWIIGLIFVAIVVGSGLTLLSVRVLNHWIFNPDDGPNIATEEPASTAPDAPAGLPVVLPEQTDSTAPDAPAETTTDTTSSEGDVLPNVTSSQGDIIPSETPLPTFSLKDSLSLPESAPGSTGEMTGDNSAITGDNAAGESGEDDGAGNVPGGPTKGDDHDRGHGNDAGGFDPDNPGNSSGIGGGDSGFDLEKLGRGDSSGGSQGGGSNGSDKGKSDDKGGGKGNSKNK